MIFVPLLLGQAMAFHAHQHLSLTLFLVAFLFGAAFQIFLLYVNDYVDEAIDRTSEQRWLSGGSRVLPRGLLEAKDLLTGAKVALVVLIGITFAGAVFFDRPWIGPGIALAVALCWAYNLPPLQLSYRGYGEILQGLGCGIVLPLIGYYIQHGSLQGFYWNALVTLYLIFHVGNIVTALPDYASDKAGQKRTFPVRVGEFRARTIALTLLAFSYVGVILSAPYFTTTTLALIVIPSSLILVFLMTSGTVRKASVANFPYCKKFVTWVSVSQAWLLCAWTSAFFLGSSA